MFNIDKPATIELEVDEPVQCKSNRACRYIPSVQNVVTRTRTLHSQSPRHRSFLSNRSKKSRRRRLSLTRAKKSQLGDCRSRERQSPDWLNPRQYFLSSFAERPQGRRVEGGVGQISSREARGAVAYGNSQFTKQFDQPTPKFERRRI